MFFLFAFIIIDIIKKMMFNKTYSDPLMKQKLTDIKGNHVYYNANFTNTSNAPVQAKFQANLAQPLLSKGSDYKMSVVRFEVPGYAIPIFIIPEYPNPLLEISISYLGSYYTSYIPTSTAPFDTSNGVYDYQAFIYLINVVIHGLFLALKTDVPSFGGTIAPYLVLDPVTELISIGFENEYWTASNGASLAFNELLYSFFQSFPTYYQAVNTNPSPDSTQAWNFFLPLAPGSFPTTSPPPSFYMNPPSYLSYVSPPTDLVATVISQDFPTLGSWVQARNIVITSESIQTRTEALPQIVQQGGNPGQPASRSIISDYALNITNSADIKSNIIYLPTAEFRWADILSDNPVTQIDFQIWWVDSSLTFHPVTLNSGANCNVKFLFQS